MRSLRLYELCLIYGGIGLIVEVIFTALSDLSWSLRGHTYLWMIPVWAIGFLVLEEAHEIFVDFSFISRAIIYAALCFAVEFVSGTVIKEISGSIPWDYSYSNWSSAAGAIRLDYMPFWAAAGLAAEKVSKIVNNIRIKL